MEIWTSMEERGRSSKLRKMALREEVNRPVIFSP